MAIFSVRFVAGSAVLSGYSGYRNEWAYFGPHESRLTQIRSEVVNSESTLGVGPFWGRESIPAPGERIGVQCASTSRTMLTVLIVVDVASLC